MNKIKASPVSERGNSLMYIFSKSKSGLPTQLLHTPLTLVIWACGSSKGSLENKPLAVIIYIRLLFTTKVWPGGRGGKTSGPSESAIVKASVVFFGPWSGIVSPLLVLTRSIE